MQGLKKPIPQRHMRRTPSGNRVVARMLAVIPAPDSEAYCKRQITELDQDGKAKKLTWPADDGSRWSYKYHNERGKKQYNEPRANLAARSSTENLSSSSACSSAASSNHSSSYSSVSSSSSAPSSAASASSASTRMETGKTAAPVLLPAGPATHVTSSEGSSTRLRQSRLLWIPEVPSGSCSFKTPGAIPGAVRVLVRDEHTLTKSLDQLWVLPRLPGHPKPETLRLTPSDLARLKSVLNGLASKGGEKQRRTAIVLCEPATDASQPTSRRYPRRWCTTCAFSTETFGIC